MFKAKKTNIVVFGAVAKGRYARKYEHSSYWQVVNCHFRIDVSRFFKVHFGRSFFYVMSTFQDNYFDLFLSILF